MESTEGDELKDQPENQVPESTVGIENEKSVSPPESLPSKTDEPEEYAVAITGLVKGTSAVELKQYLVQFTKVKKVQLITKVKDNTVGPYFAYVTCSAQDGVDKIIEGVHDKTWNGLVLKVEKRTCPEIVQLNKIPIVSRKVDKEDKRKSTPVSCPVPDPEKCKVGSQGDVRVPDSSTGGDDKRRRNEKSRRDPREHHRMERKLVLRPRSPSIERKQSRPRSPSRHIRSRVSHVERTRKTSRSHESISPPKRRRSVSPKRSRHRESSRKRDRSTSQERYRKRRSRSSERKRSPRKCPREGKDDRSRSPNYRCKQSRKLDLSDVIREREAIRKERDQIEKEKRELIQVERLMNQAERERLEQERKEIKDKIQLLKHRRSSQGRRSRSPKSSRSRSPRRTLAEEKLGRERVQWRTREREKCQPLSPASSSYRQQRGDYPDQMSPKVEFIPGLKQSRIETPESPQYVPQFQNGVPMNPPSYLIPPPPAPAPRSRSYMSYQGWPTRNMNGYPLSYPNNAIGRRY